MHRTTFIFIVSAVALLALPLAALASLSGQEPETFRQSLTDETSFSAHYFDGATLPARRNTPIAPQQFVRSKDHPRQQQIISSTIENALVEHISDDAYGCTLLSFFQPHQRLGALPLIGVGELSADVAEYDFMSHAITLDSRFLLAEIIADANPQDRADLASKIRCTQELVSYLQSNPRVVRRLAVKNDALLIHEIVHALQDQRRDSDGPTAEDELEAWVVKNLYIHSRLKSDPQASLDEFELTDYQMMVGNFSDWSRKLMARYRPALKNELITNDPPTRIYQLADLTQAIREAPGLLATRFFATAAAARSPIERAVYRRKAGDYLRKSRESQ
jgi:hypothetical protein